MLPVVIVGGGLAGLNCARVLHKNNVPFLLFEAGHECGGRVTTEFVDNYRLDVGFQVLHTAYPEAKHALHFPSLHLQKFYPGAQIFKNGKWNLLADPWRKPLSAPATLAARIGTLKDRMLLAHLSSDVSRGSIESLFARQDISTRRRLEEFGFSSDFIESFFKPFYRGVFLDPDLNTSRRMFDFMFRMFGAGEVAIPAKGMIMIPLQLRLALPRHALIFDTPVVQVHPDQVRLADGRVVGARAVVVAVDGPSASSLLGLPAMKTRSTTTLHFATNKPPLSRAIIALDGEGTGPVNHLAVPSLASPEYAPKACHLIACNCIEPAAQVPDEALLGQVLAQMTRWFGKEVQTWHLLRIHRVRHALPSQPPGWLEPADRPALLPSQVFVAGDYLATASIDGALRSGRMAAEAVMLSGFRRNLPQPRPES